MELSNYSRKKDGETNNINSATPVEKTKKTSPFGSSLPRKQRRLPH